MKLITIAWIFVFIVLTLTTIQVYNDFKQNEEIKINGLEISKQNLADISNTMQEGNFMICDISKDECFLFNKEKIK